MKRKRGCAKRKPKLAPVVGAKESTGNIVMLNTQDDLVPDDIDNTEFRSRMEFEKPQYGSKKSRKQASSQKQKVVDVNMEDNISSFPETSVAVSANVSRIARSIMSKSSRGFASSIREPCSIAEQVQGRGACQKEPNLPHQRRQYQDQELKAALEVIRKVMKMDAAEPFNVPVDPIALGIPDYFDIIDTPMDFGTICSNIENCAKYQNLTDVLRDVQYIWDNCSKYNKKGHYVLELMKRVKRNFNKLWGEAGLYMEAPETNGHSHLPATESNMRCNTERRGPLGSIADFARHQYQDQADPSRLQPPMSQCQSYQPQTRPCTYQQNSCQQQTSQQSARPNLGGAGHSHMTPVEGDVRQRPYGHRYSVDAMDDVCTRPLQKQTGQSQFQHQQHQPFFGHSQPYQPPQGFCQCHACSQQPQPSHQLAGTFTASAGDFHSSPPEESMIRCSKRGPRCPVGPMTEYVSHHQQDQVAASHMDPLQPSSDYGQEHPQQRTCRGKLSSSQLHDGFGTQRHSQPRKEMGGAGYSPPPAESMIQCTKSGPRDLVVSYQQQDQIYPSQIQPHQPQQRTGQGLQSSTQPEPSHSQADVDTGTADSSSTRRRKTRGRGPTRCLDVWNMIGKIPIVTNEFGQPIGVEAPKLVNFLGTIARNGHVAPLNYVDWRALPDENKEKMWQQVQSKFDIEPHSKSWVLKSIGNKWKNFKALLKSARYIPHKTNEGRLADRDERVLPDQWRILVSFWNSEEAKKRSIINKSCRANQKINHAAGSKSFARVREEQRAKRPDGKEPSRAELFIVTRTRKDGRPVNEASSAIISQLREQAIQRQGTSENGVVEDDVFHQVMGRDRHGRVRTYGLGPAPSDLEGPKPSHSEALKMVSEANTEVREMKERMVAMEQNCAQMAAQMATMMSMMSTMQNKSLDKHPHNVVDVSGKSEEAQQPQGPEMKSGRTTRSGKAASRKK